MGAPELVAENIPVVSETETVLDAPITVQGKEYRMTCVSMGNPHAVVFMDNVADLAIEKSVLILKITKDFRSAPTRSL